MKDKVCEKTKSACGTGASKGGNKAAETPKAHATSAQASSEEEDQTKTSKGIAAWRKIDHVAESSFDHLLYNILKEVNEFSDFTSKGLGYHLRRPVDFLLLQTCGLLASGQLDESSVLLAPRRVCMVLE